MRGYDQADASAINNKSMSACTQRLPSRTLSHSKSRVPAE